MSESRKSTGFVGRERKKERVNDRRLSRWGRRRRRMFAPTAARSVPRPNHGPIPPEDDLVSYSRGQCSGVHKRPVRRPTKFARHRVYRSSSLSVSLTSPAVSQSFAAGLSRLVEGCPFARMPPSLFLSRALRLRAMRLCQVGKKNARHITTYELSTPGASAGQSQYDEHSSRQYRIWAMGSAMKDYQCPTCTTSCGKTRCKKSTADNEAITSDRLKAQIHRLPTQAESCDV